MFISFKIRKTFPQKKSIVFNPIVMLAFKVLFFCPSCLVKSISAC